MNFLAFSLLLLLVAASIDQLNADGNPPHPIMNLKHSALHKRSENASPDQAKGACDNMHANLVRLGPAICDACNKQHSLQNPNYMPECSANCYDNAVFDKCVKTVAPTRYLPWNRQ